MSYQRERGECIAQLTKHGLPYPVIETLLRCATSINRYAELACSSEAADRDRIKCPAWHPIAGKSANAVCLCEWPGWQARGEQQHHTTIPRITLQDWRAEQRAIKAIAGIPGWAIVTSGDPRGYTLRVVPPAYIEENKQRAEHDPRTIGIPPGPSRLRF